CASRTPPMATIKAGKHVYTEKPMTHDIYEARAIAEAARKAGVMTQMGNQGHADEGNRLMVEWIRDGAIGGVREAHVWTDRPMNNWPQGIDRPTGKHRVPRGMNWDLWLGPAPNRPYHPLYSPFNWRGWWDFGTGVMGHRFLGVDMLTRFYGSHCSHGMHAIGCRHYHSIDVFFLHQHFAEILIGGTTLVAT
ncbi:MAG: hypothetical protein GH143_07805, partial [Calditrichaeota bacterium]|nr:hypothetical protein [Calditrichota bacterium]